MKCRLCGENLGARLIFCSHCSFVIDKWNDWAAVQAKRTGRWAKVTIEFSQAGAVTQVDSTGGIPGASEFVEVPKKMLPNPNDVHIKVLQRGENGMPVQSMEDIAFYLRLKATSGCTSKLDHLNDVMHLYITPGSEAAELFVQRYLRKRLVQHAETAIGRKRIEGMRQIAKKLSPEAVE